MPRFKLEDGVKVQFTPEEETQRDTDEAEALAERELEQGSNQYKTKRAKEYPSMADQLDYIYHNGLTKWKADMITPVKDKYPKPD